MPYSKADTAVLRAFGEHVRQARETRGWSQEDLAEEAGMHRTYVGAIERGERNLALLNINKLAIALGDSFAGVLPCSVGSKSKLRLSRGRQRPEK